MMDVEVTLESKVAFLRQPANLLERAFRVEAIETHMSWVFLSENYVYKLKKPVHDAALDFRDIDARRFYCEEEVRLNRRLAPDVYLGTVALTLDAAGHLRLNGRGTVIDTLVRMRRLPTEHMLDYALNHRRAADGDLDRLAAHLAGFYRTCASVPVDPQAYRSRLLEHILCNEQELGLAAYRLRADQLSQIGQAQRAFLQQAAGLFDARVQAGRIVEGHGDLRPEHICLGPPVAIIDCLEFARALRVVDTADELAFLALECERLGAAGRGERILRSYCALSGDRPARALVHFYQSYRASVRATIAVRHLKEEKFRFSPHWLRRTGDYLHLAQQHAARCVR